MELNQFSNSVLVALYNAASNSSLVKFSDKATAVKRLEQALIENGKMIVVGDDLSNPKIQDRPADGDLVSQKKTRSGRVKKTLDMNAVTLIQGKSTRKWKSTAQRFALHRSGATVRQYIDAVMAAGFSEETAIGSIEYDIKMGWITV